MKIAVFEAEDWEKGYFERLAGGHEITFTGAPLTEENAHEFSGAEVVSTFIYSNVGAGALSSFRNLRLIATRSTGYDHIDTGYCRRNGIVVANVPAYGDHTVAEHVFALILTISHRMVESIERTRRGDFSLQGLRGFDLAGKVIGVVGTGHIGRCVIEIARGFRMKVVAYDKFPDDVFAERLGFRYAGLDELLRVSDIITLHIPVTADTVEFLSEPEFELMKKGVVVINTARGSLIEVQSLLRAITSGKVAAVGLDVLPEEPVIREEAELVRSIAGKKPLETLLADHILLRLRNVFITPHNAFNTKEAVERIVEVTIDNVLSFARGAVVNSVAGPGAAAG